MYISIWNNFIFQKFLDLNGEIDSNIIIFDDFDTLLYQGRLFEQNLINLFRRNEVTKTSAYVNEIDT